MGAQAGERGLRPGTGASCTGREQVVQLGHISRPLSLERVARDVIMLKD